MIKNYLTVAIRNLMRHKLYTSINVLGLAIGLACGILILLYIQQEFAIDRSHTLGDRIYKVIREERGSTQTTYEEGTSGALGPVLKETFPEVETTVRIWRWGVSAKYGERKNLYTLALIDDNFLDVFDFPLIKGDLETAFRLPYSAVITDDMAQHLFGDMDPMGQTVSVDNRNFPGEYTVTGIVKAPHLLSDLQFHLLTTTIPSIGKTQEPWMMWLPRQSWRPVKTYVLLKAGQNAETLQTKMQSVIVQYMGDDVAANNTYHLQPLHRVYLYGESDFNPAASSPMQQIYMLAAIGLIVVVIACVNFTNLATARAVTRKREVGVRKVVGAKRSQIAKQFIGESLLLIVIALIAGIAIAELTLPTFNNLAGKDKERTIIGVVQNFHFRSLHHKIRPAVLPLSTYTGRLLVRIHPENVPGTIAFIKEQWEEIAPNQTFNLSFIDENLDKQYRKEERWNLMIQYATGFAIFIATLGAFGLAALATTRRTKEIGIRKVLGASQTQILSLLSREFVLYIALSSLIAFPIAYYATNQWLQTFAYRTELGIDTFLLGSLVLFLVVLTTVTTQTLKAVRANPADALRDE